MLQTYTVMCSHSSQKRNRGTYVPSIPVRRSKTRNISLPMEPPASPPSNSALPAPANLTTFPWGPSSPAPMGGGCRSRPGHSPSCTRSRWAGRQQSAASSACQRSSAGHSPGPERRGRSHLEEGVGSRPSRVLRVGRWAGHTWKSATLLTME